MASKSGGGPGGLLRQLGAIHLILGAIIIAGVGSLVVYDRLKQQDKNVATAQAWDIKGEPCPSVTPDEWAARHLSAPKAFDYDGDTLARWAADASCSDVKEKGGKGMGVFKVCQFAAPVSISVKTKNGNQFYFNPGVGKAATVVIQDGKARCVLGGNFTLKSEMGG